MPAFERTVLRCGDLEAAFLPERGMLGASLRHCGEEWLRRVRALEETARRGKTAGIPLLYPWANRLGGRRYEVAGKRVVLDPASELLSQDEHGLVIHGVRWTRLAWNVTLNEPDRLTAALEWDEPQLLSVFPFRHRLELAASLDSRSLTLAATVFPDEPMPVSFGFHPYFGLPGLPRTQWRLTLPAMQRLVLDERRIPTGALEPFEAFDRRLGEWDCDAGFAVPPGHGRFVLSGGGRRIAVEIVEGYGYAQIFAPRGREFVCLEPMTAPTNALVSGKGLTLIEPGTPYRASFAVRIEDSLHS